MAGSDWIETDVPDMRAWSLADLCALPAGTPWLCVERLLLDPQDGTCGC
jgi:hypothetical protein